MGQRATPGRITFLDRDDVSEVLTTAECLERVEDTFRWVGEGKVQQINPVNLHVADQEDTYGIGLVQAFPAYIEPLSAAGNKWLGFYQGNTQRDLPTINAVNVLSDAETSLPLAMMEGQSVTAMRTAGHAAVGAKYLARDDSSVVTIVGCGDQGRTHLMMMDELFDIDEVRACDVVDEIRTAFVEEMTDELGLDITGYTDAKEAVDGTDIVCTVTSADEPIVMEEWLDPGTHVAATAGFVDLDPALSRTADKWVVGWYGRDLEWIDGEEVGTFAPEGISSDDIHADLTEVIAGETPGRESPDERTVMTHMGMPALDTAAMDLVYEKAKEGGVGTELELFR